MNILPQSIVDMSFIATGLIMILLLPCSIIGMIIYYVKTKSRSDFYFMLFTGSIFAVFLIESLLITFGNITKEQVFSFSNNIPIYMVTAIVGYIFYPALSRGLEPDNVIDMERFKKKYQKKNRK